MKHKLLPHVRRLRDETNGLCDEDLALADGTIVVGRDAHRSNRDLYDELIAVLEKIEQRDHLSIRSG